MGMFESALINVVEYMYICRQPNIAVFVDKQTKDQLTGKTSLQIFGARKKSLRFYDINLIVLKKECRKK